MDEIMTSTEAVPYLEDIAKHLPIDPMDQEDINTYVNSILKIVIVNYRYAQYQFSYFGVHLLYMVYIYCSVWKISKVNPDRYNDSVLFARTYSGKEKKVDFFNIKSIFQYSNVPEKDMAKFFNIICLDPSQIGNIQMLVDKRNDMAHATGRFEVITDEQFKSSVKEIYSSMSNIHKCMDKQIRKWFSNLLIEYAKGNYDEDYSDVNDLIYEEMVQNYNFSANELLVCNEMSINEYVKNYKNYGIDKVNVVRLKTMKESVYKYCNEQALI